MKFILFCPDLFTGGPFAMLQLNKALKNIGHECEVVFYDIGEFKFLSDNTLTVKYKKKPDLSVKNFDYKICNRVDKKDFIIFPEVLLGILINLRKRGFRNTVFWWLSWDNAPLDQINYFDSILNLRASINVFQSFYAQFEAKRYGIEGQILSDYTFFNEDLFKEKVIKVNDICYLPNKSRGAESIISDLSKFFSIIPLINMSQMEVQNNLQRSKFFVDFGHHPGKDRIPREAALYECIPIVRKTGAAKSSKDIQLNKELKVNIDLLENSEKLKSHIKYIDKNRESFLKSMKPYQKTIQNEYEVFINQVKDFCNACLKRK